MREYWDGKNGLWNCDDSVEYLPVEIHYYKVEELMNKCRYSSIERLENKVRDYWTQYYHVDEVYDMWIVRPTSNYGWMTNKNRAWLRALRQFVLEHKLDERFIQEAEELMIAEVMEIVDLHL